MSKVDLERAKEAKERAKKAEAATSSVRMMYGAGVLGFVLGIGLIVVAVKR